MKALKVSVILMGVLILAGLAVVAITVARRSGGPDVVADAPRAGAAPPGFGQVTLNYPAGLEPVETVADGDRLILRFKSAAGAGRLVVLDLKTGHTLGTVVLAPEAP